jgi:hypothetical protein
MRITGAAVLALSLGVAVAATSAPGYARARAKRKAGGGEGPAPTASAAEVAKLKAVRLGDPSAGTFKWGMSPEQVMSAVRTSIEGKYQKRISDAAADPGKQQRIRGEMEREINAVKKSYTKFEGQKSGWDVSIIGPEFQQGTGESVLVTKEDQWTRYFFFFEGGLYKMYLAFTRDALQGKSFQDFGKSMEARFGNAKLVYRDERSHGGVQRSLDHFTWNAGGDKLKLVDRSEFYGVYCLVLYDGATDERVQERRKVVNPPSTEKDELVEAVTSHRNEGRDENDDIIDRVTGHEVKKPGNEQQADVVVPSPSAGFTPDDDKKKVSAKPAAEGGKKKGKKDDALDGLEL